MTSAPYHGDCNTAAAKDGDASAVGGVMRRVVQEIQRFAKHIGMDNETISMCGDDAALIGMLDSDYYGRINVDLPTIGSFLRGMANQWSRKGMHIVVDGGDLRSRRQASQMVLYWAAPHHMREFDNPAIVVEMSEVIVVMNGYGLQREARAEELERIPLLAIMEVDVLSTFRQEGDGRERFDLLLSRRERAGRPTIIVMADNLDDVDTAAGRRGIAAAFGRRFESIVCSKHAGDFVCKIRLPRVHGEGQ